jgi:hypothetical protein
MSADLCPNTKLQPKAQFLARFAAFPVIGKLLNIKSLWNIQKYIYQEEYPELIYCYKQNLKKLNILKHELAEKSITTAIIIFGGALTVHLSSYFEIKETSGKQLELGHSYFGFSYPIEKLLNLYIGGAALIGFGAFLSVDTHFDTGAYTAGDHLV